MNFFRRPLATRSHSLAEPRQSDGSTTDILPRTEAANPQGREEKEKKSERQGGEPSNASTVNEEVRPKSWWQRRRAPPSRETKSKLSESRGRNTTTRESEVSIERRHLNKDRLKAPVTTTSPQPSSNPSTSEGDNRSSPAAIKATSQYENAFHDTPSSASQTNPQLPPTSPSLAHPPLPTPILGGSLSTPYASSLPSSSSRSPLALLAPSLTPSIADLDPRLHQPLSLHYPSSIASDTPSSHSQLAPFPHPSLSSLISTTFSLPYPAHALIHKLTDVLIAAQLSHHKEVITSTQLQIPPSSSSLSPSQSQPSSSPLPLYSQPPSIASALASASVIHTTNALVLPYPVSLPSSNQPSSSSSSSASLSSVPSTKPRSTGPQSSPTTHNSSQTSSTDSSSLPPSSSSSSSSTSTAPQISNPIPTSNTSSTPSSSSSSFAPPSAPSSVPSSSTSQDKPTVVPIGGGGGVVTTLRSYIPFRRTPLPNTSSSSSSSSSSTIISPSPVYGSASASATPFSEVDKVKPANDSESTNNDHKSLVIPTNSDGSADLSSTETLEGDKVILSSSESSALSSSLHSSSSSPLIPPGEGVQSDTVESTTISSSPDQALDQHQPQPTTTPATLAHPSPSLPPLPDLAPLPTPLPHPTSLIPQLPSSQGLIVCPGFLRQPQTFLSLMSAVGYTTAEGLWEQMSQDTRWMGGGQAESNDPCDHPQSHNQSRNHQGDVLSGGARQGIEEFKDEDRKRLDHEDGVEGKMETRKEEIIEEEDSEEAIVKRLLGLLMVRPGNKQGGANEGHLEENKENVLPSDEEIKEILLTMKRGRKGKRQDKRRRKGSDEGGSNVEEVEEEEKPYFLSEEADLLSPVVLIPLILWHIKEGIKGMWKRGKEEGGNGKSNDNLQKTDTHSTGKDKEKPLDKMSEVLGREDGSHPLVPRENVVIAAMRRLYTLLGTLNPPTSNIEKDRSTAAIEHGGVNEGDSGRKVEGKMVEQQLEWELDALLALKMAHQIVTGGSKSDDDIHNTQDGTGVNKRVKNGVEREGKTKTARSKGERKEVCDVGNKEGQKVADPYRLSRIALGRELLREGELIKKGVNVALKAIEEESKENGLTRYDDEIEYDDTERLSHMSKRAHVSDQCSPMTSANNRVDCYNAHHAGCSSTPQGVVHNGGHHVTVLEWGRTLEDDELIEGWERRCLDAETQGLIDIINCDKAIHEDKPVHREAFSGKADGWKVKGDPSLSETSKDTRSDLCMRRKGMSNNKKSLQFEYTDIGKEVMRRMNEHHCQTGTKGQCSRDEKDRGKHGNKGDSGYVQGSVYGCRDGPTTSPLCQPFWKRVRKIVVVGLHGWQLFGGLLKGASLVKGIAEDLCNTTVNALQLFFYNQLLIEAYRRALDHHTFTSNPSSSSSLPSLSSSPSSACPHSASSSPPPPLASVIERLRSLLPPPSTLFSTLGIEVITIPIAYLGTVDERTAYALKELKEHVSDLTSADVVIFTAHSQGCVVATRIVDILTTTPPSSATSTTPPSSSFPTSSAATTSQAKPPSRSAHPPASNTALSSPPPSSTSAPALASSPAFSPSTPPTYPHGTLFPHRQRITISCIAGVHHGPFPDILKVDRRRDTLELFELADPCSSVALNHMSSITRLLARGVRIVATASWMDTVVPLFSGTLQRLGPHPNLLRAIAYLPNELPAGLSGATASSHAPPPTPTPATSTSSSSSLSHALSPSNLMDNSSTPMPSDLPDGSSNTPSHPDTPLYAKHNSIIGAEDHISTPNKPPINDSLIIPQTNPPTISIPESLFKVLHKPFSGVDTTKPLDAHSTHSPSHDDLSSFSYPIVVPNRQSSVKRCPTKTKPSHQLHHPHQALRGCKHDLVPLPRLVPLPPQLPLANIVAQLALSLSSSLPLSAYSPAFSWSPTPTPPSPVASLSASLLLFMSPFLRRSIISSKAHSDIKERLGVHSLAIEFTFSEPGPASWLTATTIIEEDSLMKRGREKGAVETRRNQGSVIQDLYPRDRRLSDQVNEDLSKIQVCSAEEKEKGDLLVSMMTEKTIWVNGLDGSYIDSNNPSQTNSSGKLNSANTSDLDKNACHHPMEGIMDVIRSLSSLLPAKSPLSLVPILLSLLSTNDLSSVAHFISVIAQTLSTHTVSHNSITTALTLSNSSTASELPLSSSPTSSSPSILDTATSLSTISTFLSNHPDLLTFLRSRLHSFLTQYLSLPIEYRPHLSPHLPHRLAVTSGPSSYSLSLYSLPPATLNADVLNHLFRVLHLLQMQRSFEKKQTLARRERVERSMRVIDEAWVVIEEVRREREQLQEIERQLSRWVNNCEMRLMQRRSELKRILKDDQSLGSVLCKVADSSIPLSSLLHLLTVLRDVRVKRQEGFNQSITSIKESANLLKTKRSDLNQIRVKMAQLDRYEGALQSSVLRVQESVDSFMAISNQKGNTKSRVILSTTGPKILTHASLSSSTMGYTTQLLHQLLLRDEIALDLSIYSSIASVEEHKDHSLLHRTSTSTIAPTQPQPPLSSKSRPNTNRNHLSDTSTTHRREENSDTGSPSHSPSPGSSDTIANGSSNNGAHNGGQINGGNSRSGSSTSSNNDAHGGGEIDSANTHVEVTQTATLLSTDNSPSTPVAPSPPPPPSPPSLSSDSSITHDPSTSLEPSTSNQTRSESESPILIHSAPSLQPTSTSKPSSTSPPTTTSSNPPAPSPSSSSSTSSSVTSVTPHSIFHPTSSVHLLSSSSTSPSDTSPSSTAMLVPSLHPLIHPTLHSHPIYAPQDLRHSLLQAVRLAFAVSSTSSSHNIAKDDSTKLVHTQTASSPLLLPSRL